MSRLLWLVLALVGFVLAFMAKSAILLGVGLLLGIIGFAGLVLAMASSRVSASARPETSMASVDDLGALRNRAAPTTFQKPVTRAGGGENDRPS